ncbi:hypothetical protein F0L68_18965 [Solihabitans fulvus]|uniref:Uncharacterized protein n=1 Tax=Solihabitans fulvus TaxID=1892852 RepID=A0A5B2XCL8_9PSEU|nr:hypothetical protein [Solihabitans fulvus]KAA2261033.1 hypothetical protein F0L68_18965 [Solihabitans fulvus]
MSMAQVRTAMVGVQNLRMAAESGGFAVSEEGGKALIDAIVKMQDGVHQSRLELENVKQDSKLGTSPDALVMVQYNKQVADGDPQSFAHVLQQFSTVLDETKAAINKAMSNYRNTDSGNRASFSGKA